MTTPCEHPWVGANKEENREKKGKSPKKAKNPLKSRSMADKIHHLGRKSHLSAAAKEHFRARPFLMYSCLGHPAFSFTVPSYPITGMQHLLSGRGHGRIFWFGISFKLLFLYLVFLYSPFSVPTFCLSETLASLMMLGAENT